MSTCSTGALILAEKLDSTKVLSSMMTCFLVLLARLCGSAQRFERGSEFLGENRRLLPRREVTALFRLVVVNEIGVGSLGPTPRRLILLAWKDAHGCGELHPFHVEKTAPVFPIETGRRDPCVR